jgi:hypothetical protein
VEIDRQFLIDVSDRLHPTFRSLANTTVFLCQSNGKGRAPESVGSGVLVAVGGSRYVFSASHNFDSDHVDKSKAVYAVIGDRFVSLNGEMWRTRPGTSGTDRADLAIIPLKLEGAPQGSRFVTLGEIDPFPNHWDSLPTTAYVAFGFPHSKQPRYMNGNQYSPFVHHFLTHPEPITETTQSVLTRHFTS